MERVINIIGMGSSAVIAPKEGEFWGVNTSYKHRTKIDKLFFMDDFSFIKLADQRSDPDYTIEKFLKDNPDVEIISRSDDAIMDLDGNVLAEIKRYPLKKAMELFHGGNFNSTVAYMLAYAILEKVDRIRLYGFELWAGSDQSEYAYQRPCFDFWVAFAMARGIHVEVPYQVLINATSDTSFYGYFKSELKNKE